MRDKVTRQCPQTTTFEQKGEPKQIRTEVLLLTSLTNALPVGQTGSQAICVVSPLLILILMLFSHFQIYISLFFYFFLISALYASNCHRLCLPRLSSQLSSLAGCCDVSRAQTCHVHRIGQLSFLSCLKRKKAGVWLHLHPDSCNLSL